VSYKRRNKSDRRLIKSKKQTVDGIKFKSRLEGHMYKILKKSGVKFTYEQEKFVVVSGFKFKNESYERQSNGKGDMVDRGSGKSVRKIEYTPDFVITIGETKFIIETKGFRTSEFNMRYKLFKKYILENKLDYHLYMPHTQKECDKVLLIILSKLK